MENPDASARSYLVMDLMDIEIDRKIKSARAFARSENEDDRFMSASDSFLPNGELEELSRDKSTHVRFGAFMNDKLSADSRNRVIDSEIRYRPFGIGRPKTESDQEARKSIILRAASDERTPFETVRRIAGLNPRDAGPGQAVADKRLGNRAKPTSLEDNIWMN